MSQSDAAVDAAVALIYSANLEPTEHLLLKDLIDNAVEPNKMAKYILRRVEKGPNETTEETLRSLKEDWRTLASKLMRVVEASPGLEELARRRQNAPCSLTGTSKPNDGKDAEIAYIIPPTFVTDTDTTRHEGRLYPLLESFLTGPKISQLRTMASDESTEGSLRNSWLLSPSIHWAFRKGHIRIRPKYKINWEDGDEVDIPGTSEAHYMATKAFPGEFNDLYFGDESHYGGIIHAFALETTDPETLPLPSAFLLRIHCRFANALNLFSIEDQIASGWPPQPSALLNRNVQENIRAIWLFVPRFVRELCYRVLLKAGKYIYPRESSGLVSRVPFGLYIKNCARSEENEPTALRMVHDYTTIPAPLPIDTFRMQGQLYMVMTRIQGRIWIDVFHLMSYQERDQLADDLKGYVKQLRSIPNKTPYLFADTNGGVMVDHRLPDGKFGPFNSEADFNNHLYRTDGSPVPKEFMAPGHLRTHRSYFTHSDLHCTNILVEGGRLSGIVDWECAAFKPEYWEFTKAMYGVWNKKPMEAVFRRAFDYQYEEELKAEQELWRQYPL